MSRYGRQSSSNDEEEQEGADAELNLIPYLDIMMNLVIFLIFSFQVIIEFRLIDVIPPAFSSSGSSSNSDEKPKATITLAITESGYKLLSSTSDVMPAIDIPMQGGEYDTDELHDRLVSWKQNFDLGESIIFMADLNVEYKVIIQSMDAIRNDGEKLLFPDVLLARQPGGG